MPVENLCLWSSLNDSAMYNCSAIGCTLLAINSSVYCCLLGCCVLLWCYHSRLMQREMWHQASGFSLRSFHESQSTMHVICSLLLCGLLKFRERAKQSTTLPRFRSMLLIVHTPEVHPVLSQCLQLLVRAKLEASLATAIFYCQWIVISSCLIYTYRDHLLIWALHGDIYGESNKKIINSTCEWLVWAQNALALIYSIVASSI